MTTPQLLFIIFLIGGIWLFVSRFQSKVIREQEQELLHYKKINISLSKLLINPHNEEYREELEKTLSKLPVDHKSVDRIYPMSSVYCNHTSIIRMNLTQMDRRIRINKIFHNN